MWKRFTEFYTKYKRPIWQGVIVCIICIALAIACVGCSSFSGDSASPQFGLSNTAVTLTSRGVD